MGKQIEFHMTESDCSVFVKHLHEQHQISFVLLSSLESAEVHSYSKGVCASRETLIIWRHDLLPLLQRTYIPRSDIGPYYRIDGSKLPVLEFSPSIKTRWHGHPGIIKGRIYGDFTNKPREFLNWYESIVRWIRKNYQRDLFSLGSYVGPDANNKIQQGWLLFPSFVPPDTPEWRKFFSSQNNKLK